MKDEERVTIVDFAGNDHDRDRLRRDTELDWQRFCDRVQVGQRISGVVVAARDYGAYLDFGERFPALVEVTNFARTRYPIPIVDLLAIGVELRGEIIQVVPWRRFVRAIERDD